MKCDICPALQDDSGFEHSATECWCALGEEPIEFADGSEGCNRKSVEKIKRDMKLQAEVENEAFAKECGEFMNWLDSRTFLYLVHDEDYNYRVVIRATNSEEAVAKLHRWLAETNQNGELWSSKNVKWYADLCDNDKVIE